MKAITGKPGFNFYASDLLWLGLFSSPVLEHHFAFEISSSSTAVRTSEYQSIIILMCFMTLDKPLMTYFCITLYCFRNVQWIYRTAGSGWKLCSLFSLPQFFPSWLSFRKALGFLDLWKRLWGLLEQMPSKCKSLGFLRKMEYDCRIDAICAWSSQFYFTHLVSF